MKNRPDIQFKALLLLLVYLFCNSPSTLFHHHKSDIASYGNSTACEKVIHYSDKAANCNHNTHITVAIEKCSLCDNHTVSPHSFQTELAGYFSRECGRNYLQDSEKYFFYLPSTFFNKGPPSISSFAV